jgi:pSer/pThr/pTyr-binding forkhead associated (FHA) protein
MTIPIAGAAQPAPEAAPAGAPVGFLSSLDGSGKQYPLLPGTNEIGARPPAAIVLSRPEVSSRHASIDCRREADGLWRITLLDRGSTNGTYVNGKRVTSRELRGGDRIAFAKPEYAYELRIPAAAGDERFTMRVR